MKENERERKSGERERERERAKKNIKLAIDESRVESYIIK